MTHETVRAIFEFVCLVLIIFILFRVGQMYGSYCRAVMKAENALENRDTPDLMDQALLNIAMNKMRKDIREMLVYAEPTPVHDLLREYMRLREKRELDAKQK
jgi:uncharacterized membrane protein YvbJ